MIGFSPILRNPQWKEKQCKIQQLAIPLSHCRASMRRESQSRRSAHCSIARLRLRPTTVRSCCPIRSGGRPPSTMLTKRLPNHRMTACLLSRTSRAATNQTSIDSTPQGAERRWHPRMSSRLGLFRLVQMPGRHEVIFTNPGGLAAKLIEAGRD